VGHVSMLVHLLYNLFLFIYRENNTRLCILSGHPPITIDLSVYLTVPLTLPHSVHRTHHDLRGSNILYPTSSSLKGALPSAIDWQHTSVGPLYMQACVPHVFRYHALWNTQLEITTSPSREPARSNLNDRQGRYRRQEYGVVPRHVSCTMTMR
jgi:hypothetical protein